MKKIFRTILFLFLPICLVSCGGSGDDFDDGSNSANKIMVGTKWTSTNWDYGTGDDWVTIYDETINLYFYSSTEGMMYYGKKEDDSDFGSSLSRIVAFFTYNVNGNRIELDYITEEIFTRYSHFQFDGNTITKNDFTFVKSTIDSSDQSWLNTLHGATGECNWYHNLKSSIWIVGEGDMDDYSSYSETPWSKNERIPSYVHIEDGVTSVGANAFANSSVGSVGLPSSLKSIGANAFAGTTISEIKLGNDITIIGDGAFSGCSYLENVYIPDMVEQIGSYAFSGCNNIYLSGTPNLRSIGVWAFYGCTMTGWTDSELIEELNSLVFTGSTKSKIVMPNSLKRLVGIIFSTAKINEIHLGSNLETIGGTPFYVAKTGKLYVNKETPVVLSSNIVEPLSGGDPSKWTLYVPEGSASAYKNADYWKNFGKILEDSSLSDDETNEDKNDEEGEDVDITIQGTDEGTVTEINERNAKDSRRGQVSEAFSGYGTESNPYLIQSAADLRFLSDCVRAGLTYEGQYFKMTSDIIINSSVVNSSTNEVNDDTNFERWIPIGTDLNDNPFKGVFNGDGHYISGIYINRNTKTGNSGLFGYVYNGTIKNLTIKDSYIQDSGSATGGVVGEINAGSGSAIYITNNSYDGIVYNTSDGKSGGICGLARYGFKIEKCINYALIKSSSSSGSILGASLGNRNGYVYNCINQGSVKGNIAGGIIGYQKGYNNVRNSVNRGEIVGDEYAGGICGKTEVSSSSIFIKNSVNVGVVSSSKTNGGIVGYLDVISSGKCSVLYNYFRSSINSLAVGKEYQGSSGSGTIVKTGTKGYSDSEMKSSNIRSLLNSNKESEDCTWISGSDGYPIIKW